MNEQAALEAVVAGHICLDVFPTLKGEAIHFSPGQTVEAGPALFSTGGAVSNTGLALHLLGVSTRLMGKVGVDLFGRAILELLEAHDPALTHGMIVSPVEATSYSLILSTPHADRMLIHSPGCNDTFAAADILSDVIAPARLFHFGCPPLMARMYQHPGELSLLFQRVKTHQVTTSLDLSLPDPHSAAGKADWLSILSDALPYVDLFLPSALEITLMLRHSIFEQIITHPRPLDYLLPSTISDLGQALLDMGVKIVGLKLGDRGFYLRTAEKQVLSDLGRAKIVDDTIWNTWAGRELWMPCYTAQVMGTTGSGDATIAGLLLALLRNMPVTDALRAACAVGACSVEAVDALSAIPSWPAIAARLSTNWPQFLHPFAHKSLAPGWRWHDQERLWIGPRDKDA